MAFAQRAGMSSDEPFGISPLNGSTADMVLTRATFLCADVVRFTAMTERLGDQTSFRLMRRVARLVQAEAARRHGTVVEVRGDSFLLALAHAPQAVQCALAIHEALEEDASRHADGGVEVRMAIHTGEAIRIRDQFFGLHVILPFRLLAHVPPGKIAVTETADPWSTEASPHPLAVQRFHPKGFRNEVAFALLEAREMAAERGRREEAARGLPIEWAGGAQLAVSGT